MSNVKVVLCISCPLPNKTMLEFGQGFKACWSFCFELKVSNESKYSLLWVRPFGNVYFLSQKRPKSICNKKIGILTISSVSPELQHSDCVDWMYSELEIREKSPLSGLPFEVGPPLISYTKTQMHHWWGQLKLQDIIFLISHNKENWKSKRMNSFIMVSVSVVLVNVLLLKRNRKNRMMKGMRAK